MKTKDIQKIHMRLKDVCDNTGVVAHEEWEALGGDNCAVEAHNEWKKLGVDY